MNPRPTLLAAALLLAAPAALAQEKKGEKGAPDKPPPEQYRDEVHLVNPRGGAPLKVSNVEVTGETCEKVEWKPKAGSPMSRPAAEVALVRYGDTPDYFKAAIEAWRAGRWLEALQEFSGAKSASMAGKARPWCAYRSDAYMADCSRHLAAESKSPAAEYSQAADLYKKAAEEEPKSPLLDMILLGRAEAQSAYGQHEGALQSLDQLIKAAQSAKLPLWEARARLLRGRVLERKGEALSAVNEYGDLAETAGREASSLPADSEGRRTLQAVRLEALVRKGWALMARAEQTKSPGDVDTARSHFERLATESGGAVLPKAAATNGAGVAALLRGDAKAALAKFLEVEVTMFGAPEEVARALWYKSKAYEALGDARRREEALKDLAEYYPWSEWANRAR